MTQSNDWHSQFQSDLEAMRLRMEDHFENQARLNADLRTRQELQSQQIAELRESIAIARERDDVQTQNLMLQAQNVDSLINAVSALIQEFRQHRSDNHGA